MKAALIREHGGLDKVRVEQMPQPRPAPGEVLVEVRAASLNHLDIWVRLGGRFNLAMPHVLGCDASGVVAEVGAAQGVQVAQEVIVNPVLSCGHCEFRRAGQQMGKIVLKVS